MPPPEKTPMLIAAGIACVAFAALVLQPVTTPSASARPTPVRPLPTPVLVQPVVVTAPSQATSGRTWVPGRYVDQVLPDGHMIRVWVPGYWR